MEAYSISSSKDRKGTLLDLYFVVGAASMSLEKGAEGAEEGGEEEEEEEEEEEDEDEDEDDGVGTASRTSLFCCLDRTTTLMT